MISSDISFPAETLSINRGDTLFLFTDGAFEQFNAVGTMFGEDKLKDTITESLQKTGSISQCNKSLLDSIKTFTGGYGLTDDITVIAVQKT